MWEFDDNRAAPSSLVLEQDFILRIRRLHRLGTPHLVANIAISEIPADYSGRGTLQDAQKRLQALVLVQKGSYCEMSNGDVFLIWPDTPIAKIFPEQAMMVILPYGVAADDFTKYVTLFNIPNDYALLRERSNHYVNASREMSLTNEDENSPANLLKSELTRGPLTAWSVNLIEKLTKDIDLCQFIRSQSIYEYQKKDDSWKQFVDEAFIGLDDCKAMFFPHIDLSQPKHLFLDLCQVLDRSLLETLTSNYESVSDMNLNLNLSLHTVLGLEFAQFTRRIPRSSRGRVGFEIHCGDLLQDFTQTLNAMGTMRQEGFKLLIDGVTPDMLGYFNFARFDVDFIKINVCKDNAASLKFQAIRENFVKLPKEKLIFFHCDSEQALTAGIDLGVTKFQGWLVDDKARSWRKG
ncbi:MAG: EAL domain-containing protein [Alphaproteobacteria bacterium]|nr:EAL domain-containing protein [Alphaproteobacteria bacterium]